MRIRSLAGYIVGTLEFSLDFGSDSVVIQEVTESDIKEMRATLAAKGNWFRSVAGADHRRLEWRPILGFPTDAPVREGRSVDLIVIGHTMGAGDAYGSLDQGGLLLKIGRPTLVVPEGVAMRRAQRHFDQLQGARHLNVPRFAAI